MGASVMSPEGNAIAPHLPLENQYYAAEIWLFVGGQKRVVELLAHVRSPKPLGTGTRHLSGYRS